MVFLRWKWSAALIPCLGAWPRTWEQISITIAPSSAEDKNTGPYTLPCHLLIKQTPAFRCYHVLPSKHIFESSSTKDVYSHGLRLSRFPLRHIVKLNRNEVTELCPRSKKCSILCFLVSLMLQLQTAYYTL